MSDAQFTREPVPSPEAFNGTTEELVEYLVGLSEDNVKANERIATALETVAEWCRQDNGLRLES